MRVKPVQPIVKTHSSTEYNYPKQKLLVDECSTKVLLNERTHIVVYDNQGKLRGF